MKKGINLAQYTAFFEKNELGGYTVTIPSLPGLVTEGRTIDEAKKMAENALQCYIDGMKKAKQVVTIESEVGSFRVSASV
jgi:predicted RNase H-like HicB family nuclease